MNKIEAKIKELGLPIEVVAYKSVVYLEGFKVVFKGFDLQDKFETWVDAYNWVAKEFNLMSLIRKDEVVKALDLLITEKSFNLVDEESNMPDEMVIHIDKLQEIFEWLDDK